MQFTLLSFYRTFITNFVFLINACFIAHILGVQLAKDDLGSVFGPVLQKKTAVFSSVSVLQN